MELAYLHDWNVVYVPDGKDIRQLLAASSPIRQRFTPERWFDFRRDVALFHQRLGPHAQPHQMARQPVCPRLQLPVGQRPILRHHRHPIRPRRRFGWRS